VLQDINKAALQCALVKIKRNLGFLTEKGLMKDNPEEIFEKIEVTTDLKEAVEEADYIQESIPERYDLKKKIFRQVDNLTQPHAIIASSTSTLKMTVIQEAAENPERCITAHPWNPPYLMPLVEIIPGEKLRLKPLRKPRDFMTRIGKVAVIQKKETIGSIGNRLAAALWREAISLVDEGIADLEDVDRAVSAGPGLRWAIIGLHLSCHLGGGERGIEHFLEHLGPRNGIKMVSLAKWNALPPLARRKIIKGIKDYSMLKEKFMEDLIRWRDNKIAEILKILYGEDNR